MPNRKGMKRILAMAVVACALLGVVPVVSRALTPDAPARTAPGLDAALASAGSDRVVVFVHGTSRDAALAAIDEAGMSVVTVFESVGVPAATGTPEQVRDLLDADGVTYVEPDRKLQYFLDTSRVAIRAREAKKTPGLGFDGSGQTIAIVDGGVDGTHPMFTLPDGSSKVVRNFKVAADGQLIDVTSMNDSDTMSAGGHGTHVAAIAAGVRVESGGTAFSGVATGAKIVAFSTGAAVAVLTANTALDWIARNHKNPCGDKSCPPITVVNNSYGATGEYDPNSVTNKIQNKIVNAGVVMVWANGNGDATNNGGDGTDNRSGDDAQNPKPGIISVANYDDADTGSRDGALSDSSSRGDAKRPETWPDLSAPGTSILSACRPYLPICNSANADPNYGAISGTSMAAPHVAGVVTLLRQANPALTPAQIEDILEDTAYKFTFGAPYQLSPRTGNDTGSSFDKGHGLVDVVAALGRALSTTVAPGPATACPPNGLAIVDPARDATQPTGPSEPSLDVRSVSLAWDATKQALTSTMKIEDLTDTNPPGSVGIAFEVGFSHAGTIYALSAARNAAGERARLLGPGSPAREPLADLDVKFDPAADTVTVILRNAHLKGTRVPRLADGVQLTGLTADAMREMGAPPNPVNEATGVPRGVLVFADDATGPCPFTLGTGVAAPAPTVIAFPEPPAPSVDGAVTPSKPFERTGKSPADNFQYTCRGVDDPKCITFRVDVQPSGKSTLDIVLSTDVLGAAVDDWDLFVYDANGHQVAVSGWPQTVIEAVSLDVSARTQYTIVVQPYTATKESPYTLSASLSS